jgi:hypothetical protein
VAGAVFFLIGLGIAFTIENAALRYAGSITACALALGLLRRGLRLE